jgi:hypothetical protein
MRQICALMIVGIAFTLAALLLVLSVLVNLPISSPGAVLVVLFGALGVDLARRSIEGLRKRRG